MVSRDLKGGGPLNWAPMTPRNASGCRFSQPRQLSRSRYLSVRRYAKFGPMITGGHWGQIIGPMIGSIGAKSIVPKYKLGPWLYFCYIIFFIFFIILYIYIFFYYIFFEAFVPILCKDETLVCVFLRWTLTEIQSVNKKIK